MRTDDRTASDVDATHDRRTAPDPHVRTDAHRRGDDPLILDRDIESIGAMVEVSDVHIIGEEAALTDAHIEERVDDAAAAEHDLRSDRDTTCVRPQRDTVTDPRPGSDDDAAKTLRRGQFDVTLEEAHAVQMHVLLTSRRTSSRGAQATEMTDVSPRDEVMLTDEAQRAPQAPRGIGGRWREGASDSCERTTAVELPYEEGIAS
jgi:hypothetical protein